MSSQSGNDNVSWEISSFDTLSDFQKNALRTSICVLYEFYLDDLAALMKDDTDFDETMMSTALPPRFKSLYNCLFAKKFFACFVAATERIRNSEHPRCVAEEMAVKEIFSHAISMTKDDGLYDEQTIEEITEGLYDYEEDLFEDQDFLFLWDGKFDGIEYIHELGMANLGFSQWFNAFRKARPVNPFVEDDEPEEQ